MILWFSFHSASIDRFIRANATLSEVIQKNTVTHFEVATKGVL